MEHRWNTDYIKEKPGNPNCTTNYILSVFHLCFIRGSLLEYPIPPNKRVIAYYKRPTRSIGKNHDENFLNQRFFSRNMSRHVQQWAIVVKRVMVMHETSKTLLRKLRDPNDVAAWHRFVELYLPLLFYRVRMMPMRGADPDDLVQDVLLKLVQKLPEFHYDPNRGGFRNWLRTLCHNQWRDHWRKRGNHTLQLNEERQEALEVNDLRLEQFWNEDYYGLLVAETFRIIENEFDATTRTAFAETVMKGAPSMKLPATFDSRRMRFPCGSSA